MAKPTYSNFIPRTLIDDLLLQIGDHGTPLAVSAAHVINLLNEVLVRDTNTDIGSPELSHQRLKDLLSGIKILVGDLSPQRPMYATFHDNIAHDPLSGGSQEDFPQTVLNWLVEDEHRDARKKSEGQDKADAAKRDSKDESKSGKGKSGGIKTSFNKTAQSPLRLPTRPIIIHVWASPNLSLHVGKLIIFCYAFALAPRLAAKFPRNLKSGLGRPVVSVRVTIVDAQKGKKVDGTEYQKPSRPSRGELKSKMDDYNDVFQRLQTFSGVVVDTEYLGAPFLEPEMVPQLRYIIANRQSLEHRLSPTHGKLGLRAACPVQDCRLVDKHVYLRRGNYNMMEVSETDWFAAMRS